MNIYVDTYIWTGKHIHIIYIVWIREQTNEDGYVDIGTWVDGTIDLNVVLYMLYVCCCCGDATRKRGGCVRRSICYTLAVMLFGQRPRRGR